MSDFLKLIIDKLSTLSKKSLVGWGIALLLFGIAIFPYIDTNLFYPNRIKNRIEILDMVTNLNIDKIQSNNKLKKEYDNILVEINKSSDKYVNNFIKTKENESKFWKFFSGAILWWIFAIIMLFYNDKTVHDKKQKWINRIGGFLMLSLFGIFIGWIFSIIPIIGNQWVNYIGAPILTIVIMVLLFYKTNKK